VGTVYFCPDLDIPLAASGLLRAPVLEKYAYTEKPAVLIDAHRAPDDWFTLACAMPNLILQGDPCAMRPSRCSLFYAELVKQPVPAAPRVRPQLQFSATLHACIGDSLGRTVVLCGSYETRDRLYDHLRPDGMQAGDGAMDRHGKYTQVHETPTGASVVSVDGGRRFARQEYLTQHVVVSPSTVRSSEYDTVIVMPDVPEMIAQAVCRRARYLVIGVGHSPYGYIY